VALRPGLTTGLPFSEERFDSTCCFECASHLATTRGRPGQQKHHDGPSVHVCSSPAVRPLTFLSAAQFST